MSSAATSATPSQAKSNAPSSSDMEYYYDKLLPFKYIFQWLSHSPKPTIEFIQREFAYEYRSGAYQRYNSFSNAEEFKESVVRANPTRFEIGAVYEKPPKDRKLQTIKTKMQPVSKELVFDIDLTDYDEIRTCCSKTDICTKCWKFVTVATKIIDVALREDFGFEHLIWVFSGRRGAHCWVSDKRARLLDESARRGIVEYLDLLKNKSVNKRLNLRRPYHPHVQRSLEILKKPFIEVILEEQDPWANDDEPLLASLPDKVLVEELSKLWKQNPGKSSFDKWQDIDKVASKIKTKNRDFTRILRESKEDIIIETMYPRLDVEVSRQMIHLLKSPFCIHPSTGNICVPFDPRQGFDPTSSPNLRQVQQEIEQYKGDATVEWEKTSMKPYVDLFTKFVSALIKDDLKSAKRERDEEPAGLDF